MANKPIWGTCPDYNINVTASSNSDYTLAGSDRNGTVTGNDPSITINVGDEINFIVNAAGFLLNNKHHFSILYAPLKTSVTGTLSRNILFDGKDFKANIPLEAIYKFNSYRLTYNRRILIKNNFILGLGISAKIRDAGTSLKNEEVLSENFSIGLVPLMNLIANWNISQKTNVEFLGEGLVASKGRAIDLSLSGSYSFTKNFQGNIGYRLLEGGVDGAIRYNFIQLHFVFASLKYSFKKTVNQQAYSL